MMLAQRGLRVLLLDRAKFPSDKPLSTHGVLKTGGAVLKRLGLLPRVIASNCPPIRTCLLDPGPFEVMLESPSVGGVDAMYAPRRYVLDTVLVEGATGAGAELRERVAVTELVWEGEGAEARVVGVRGHDLETEAPIEERGRIVIGADGVHSLVARLVKAPRYEEIPLLTGVYWSYWEGVPIETGLEMHMRPGRMIGLVSTNDGLTNVGVYFPVAEFERFKSDVEGNFFANLEQHVPEIHERVRAGRKAVRWLGTGYQPNFFRKPHGLGWALVGDASSHHDSANPSGISYAFVDAERLAAAIDDGLGGRRPLADALADYERQRNERWLPHYHFLTKMLELDKPPSPEMMGLLGRVAEDPKGIGAQFLGLVEGDDACYGLLQPMDP